MSDVAGPLKNSIVATLRRLCGGVRTRANKCATRSTHAGLSLAIAKARECLDGKAPTALLLQRAVDIREQR